MSAIEVISGVQDSIKLVSEALDSLKIVCKNTELEKLLRECEDVLNSVLEWDNGGERYDLQSDPDIKQKINGVNRPRGWGLFLIQNLMDEVEIKYVPKKGNVIRMVMYLKPPPSSFQ